MGSDRELPRSSATLPTNRAASIGCLSSPGASSIPACWGSLPDPTERRTDFAAGFEEVRTMVGATVTYFTASSSAALGPNGTLANIDTVNAVLDDGAITYDMAVPPEGQTAWVQVVTDGCLRDGATQRMVSPLYAVSADRVDGSLPTADLVLFASARPPTR